MYMLGITGAEVIDTIRSYVNTIAVAFAELWFWPIIFIGIMILAVIVLGTLVRKSYENKILKSVNKLNKYFLSKPFITEENLVEFNLKMKKVPKVLRNNWQIYMLNREDAPTKYINVDTCIDKPLKTGSIEKNMKNFTTFTILLAILSFAVGLQYASVANHNQLVTILFDALFIPLALAIIYTITILAVRASKNDIYACLYDNFPLYERNLTKAVTTLPAYVDYEILFTKKEIKEGIPILQQYLEKRALVEQQELERARENSLAVEEYDFSDLGVDGSLILERSMKESETFINIRRRLQDEIGSIETEITNYKKNYEETLKDLQRKLQASRENLESLKTQQEESTNRIESNYIRKQQADEIKKQQQLEKDIEEATTKFNDEQLSLQQDIEKREKEIAEKKEFVEQAMSLEFKHYANILYKALTEKATEVGNQRLLTLAQENSDLKALLTDIQGVGGADVDVQDELIQKEDLTGENLYDMSTKDMNELNETREQSAESEVVETQETTSEAQEIANETAEVQEVVEPEIESQESESAVPPLKIETSEEPVQYEDNVQHEEAQQEIVEEQEPEQESPAQETSTEVENEQVESQDNQSEDLSVQNEAVAQNYVEESSQNEDVNIQSDDVEPTREEQVEDLDQIQRQIDENNKILQKNKEEFESDLNKTISKFDEEDDNEYEDEYEEEPANEYEHPSRDLKQDRYEEREPRRTTRERSRIDSREERDNNYGSRRTVRRRVSDSREKEEPTTRRRSRSRRVVDEESHKGTRRTSRLRREDDSTSDFDELNREMQKLLRKD